jgi:CRP-like cAMP-binding protein
LIDFNAGTRYPPLTTYPIRKPGEFRNVTPRRLTDQIGGLFELTPSERVALERLEERERVVRRGQPLLRENDRSTDLFFLIGGQMMSYVLLDDGSRQILRFLFPGDVLATAAIGYATSPETLVALTESTVCAIDRAQLVPMAREHPRLLLAIAALEQAERAALIDRLANVGRTSAKARVAAVMLDIRDRMRRGDPSIGDSFVLGLTQEEIGDATGLTAVHVNRMLRALEDERLIARAAGRVTFLDERMLRRVANYVDRMTGIDLNWIPAPAED